jgi:hypothetical protein
MYPNDNIQKPVKSSAASQSLIEFDQNEFLPAGSAMTSSMDSIGYAYVPAACQTQGFKK